MTKPRPQAILVAPHRGETELGIRHGLLTVLAREGKVGFVPWRGRIRIPRSEIDRLAREGLTPTGRRPRAPKVRGSAACDPEALRNLDLRTL